MILKNLPLVYNDYDGATGTTYAYCSANNGGFLATAPGTDMALICGTTFVGVPIKASS